MTKKIKYQNPEFIKKRNIMMKFKKGSHIKNENGDVFIVEKIDFPFYELKIYGNRKVGSYKNKRRLSMRVVELRFTAMNLHKIKRV